MIVENYNGGGKPRLLFRDLVPNKAFKSHHFSDARKKFTEPTLTNVAK